MPGLAGELYAPHACQHFLEENPHLEPGKVLAETDMHAVSKGRGMSRAAIERETDPDCRIPFRPGCRTSN